MTVAEVDAHVARTGLARAVVEALLNAGLTPPRREVVDRVGFNSEQVRALLPILSASGTA